jgi:hypothetical protein
MKIKVNLEASETTNHWRFDLDELNYTESEWLELSKKEKEKAIKEYQAR